MTPVQIFFVSARNFCCWVESDVHDLAGGRLLLLELLRDVGPLRVSELPDALPLKAPTNPQFSDLPFQYYWSIFDCQFSPNGAPEACLGDLCDDLSDIYGELLLGIELVQSGLDVEAESHWRFSYNSHWGRHAVDAFAALDSHWRCLSG